MANIYQLATINLNHLGVHRIYGGHFCTYFNHQLFYSYRREKGQTGRMATVIWINT
ncbi:laccase domain-containing protein [Candidatus Coxiella mudrowiae]|uniref:laccase domain-containing protein n=1 Tax=Candidatus Coxiella mudrowiae TaxID=2054173 RepID=UPI000A577D12|nr:laccase domain-containing protein [Candidatus Coxiella mudrowiae]